MFHNFNHLPKTRLTGLKAKKYIIQTKTKNIRCIYGGNGGVFNALREYAYLSRFPAVRRCARYATQMAYVYRVYPLYRNDVSVYGDKI